jgi:hypothetical protein
MTETTTVRDAHAALKEDHRRLHDLVRSLRESPDLPHLVVALEQLHEALARHFQLEENPGGLYDALGVCVPEFRASLGRLVDDHYRLSAQVRDLRDKARALVPRTHDELRRDSLRLADLLADHERREHEMVDQAIAKGA